MEFRCHCGVLVPAVFAVFLLGPASAFADTSELILGGTAYTESGSLEGEEVVSVEEEDESFDYDNDNFLSARLLYLKQYAGNFYVGPGVDFIGNLRAVQLEDDGEPAEEDPEYYSFGPLMEALAVGEWRVPLTEDYVLGLNGQLGIGALFPRGDFADEIEGLQDENVGVWDVPRLAGSVGAGAAFLWNIDDRISLRSDLRVQWQTIFLFRTTETVDNVSFRKQWTTDALRTRLGVYLQVDL